MKNVIKVFLLFLFSIVCTSGIYGQRTVTGTVVDKNQQPVPGVNVVVTGTTTGAVTDIEGKYTIQIPQDSKSLTFSFIGMEPQEMIIGTLTQVNVTMTESAIGLEEVVVTGYGTAKKVTLTGSVTQIDGKKLNVAPSINLTNTLSGRLPGLVVVSPSGEPGRDDAILRIRGSNTLGNNAPLIVVDGISHRSLQNINSSDIQTITVLKDASAAIYGAQAANGVILITTKRGQIGKPVITATLNQGFNMPTVTPKMSDAATYATALNEINSYRDLPARFSAEEIQKMRDGSDPWGYPNTDWMKAVFAPYSLQNNVNVSVSGGSETMKYFVSMGHKYQDGNFKNSGTNYKQTDFRANLDTKITKNINLGIDLAGREENRKYPTKSTNTVYDWTIRGYPFLNAFWPNGLPGPGFLDGESPNVMATGVTGYDNEKSYIVESNLKLNVIIPWVKGLNMTVNTSFDKSISNRKLWQTPYTLYSWDGVTYDSNNIPVLVPGMKGYSEPRLTQNMIDGQNVTINGLINYEHSFANVHNIKILAGIERKVGESMNFEAYRRYYISRVSQELFAGGDLQKDNTGSSSTSARLNYFGRVNYNYSEKYMVDFVWRYDGSFIFPAKSRFGFFPGVSLGWRVSEEGFWKDNISFINNFKLRGSWGQTGNDQIAPYQFLSAYGFGDAYVFNNSIENKTLNELGTPNTNVTWEVANQSNIGFDGQMYGGRLTFSADYFYNNRTNILWWRNASVPETAGITLPQENIGEVINQGFEFEIGYNNKAGDFTYYISANTAFQKNKISFWDETPGIPEYQQTTGHPMNSILLYKSIGVFKDEAAINAYPHWAGARPGDLIFEDYNKDGEINALDMVRSYKSNIPTLTGGVNIEMEYKNFYTKILIQGAAGAQVQHVTYSGGRGNFLASDTEGRWTTDNTSADKPRVWDGTEEYWQFFTNKNTYFMRNNNYIRLKNLEVGYNMPKKVNEFLKIEGMRIYVNTINMLTLTKMKDFDPEASDGTGIYPPLKIYNLGIALTF